MNDRRLRIIESNQSGTAKKVLAAVPIASTWTFGQIMSELSRHGSSYSPPVVEGCLNSLRDDGLIKEKQKGMWQRIYIENDPVIEGTATPMPDAPKPNLINTLGDLAEKLRKLADDIDTAALQVADEISRANEGGSKLKQLQKLLRETLS